jgi:hypothetical protein
MNVEHAINELFRRFRWALAGYVVLALAVIAGLAVSYVHERDINNDQKAIKRNTYQLAVLLAAAEYQICKSSDDTRMTLKLDNLIDCHADRQSAVDIYQRLTSK